VSATSLDVVRHYAAAQEAASNTRFEEAMQQAQAAVELDPEFGIGYQLLAVTSRNLGKVQDAGRYIQQALQYVGKMTEREVFSTRGFYLRLTGDYQKCVEEYGAMIDRYAADVVGHNQLALCLTQLRDMGRAVTEMQKVVDLLPNRALFRYNLAWYSSYAGRFEDAEREARAIEVPDAYSTLALAFAQAGQGRLDEAAESYRRMASMGEYGASRSASGLGDLAAVQGRYADAVRLLTSAAAADLAADNPEFAAAKLAAVAHAELSRGRPREAIAAAEQALGHSGAVKIRFLAARTLAAAGADAKAQPLAASLASELQAEPRAYAKIVEAEIALAGQDARRAVALATDANALLDTWIGRFTLGRAYLAAGAFPQADAEFDRCLRRGGEALSMFLDEEPTYTYFPAVHYYRGRVREGLNSKDFADADRTYLALRGSSAEDPLAAELRRRP
jgi:tetratricopeptide (TPR) repeat protein